MVLGCTGWNGSPWNVGAVVNCFEYRLGPGVGLLAGPVSPPNGFAVPATTKTDWVNNKHAPVEFLEYNSNFDTSKTSLNQ